MSEEQAIIEEQKRLAERIKALPKPERDRAMKRIEEWLNRKLVETDGTTSVGS